MPKVSVVVPYSPMKDHVFFLDRLVTSLKNQSFTDYELVITQEGRIAENTNAAMLKATGELVKILYLDDYFSHEDSIKLIVDNFTEDDAWLATGCFHDDRQHHLLNPHLPYYSFSMLSGINTIGSPSVITMRRDKMLLFDENLDWLLDCDLYHRMYEQYGPPKILNDYNITIGIGAHQLTNTLTKEHKEHEYEYLAKKYAN